MQDFISKEIMSHWRDFVTEYFKFEPWEGMGPVHSEKESTEHESMVLP